MVLQSMNNLHEKRLNFELDKTIQHHYLFDLHFYRIKSKLFRKLLFRISKNHDFYMSDLKYSLAFPFGSICEDSCIEFHYLLCLNSLCKYLSPDMKKRCFKHINNYYKPFNKTLSRRNVFSFDNLQNQWPVLVFKNLNSFNSLTPIYLKNLNKRFS